MKVTIRGKEEAMEVVGTTTIKGYTYFVLLMENGKFTRQSIDECTFAEAPKKKVTKKKAAK